MTPLAMKMKEVLKPLYQKLIENTDDYCHDKFIYPFVAQWGEHFPTAENEGLLFVGRATNGWKNEDLKADVIFDEHSDERIFNRDDQMVWISRNDDEKYNTNRSAFLRTLRCIARAFYPNTDEVNYVAWTNVCKLAPEAGNPNDKLYYLQLDDAADIFRAEVETLSPKFVIMCTGINWAYDFICALNGNTDPLPEQEVAKVEWSGKDIIVYKINGRYIIMAEHPQGKDEVAMSECIIDLIHRFN